MKNSNGRAENVNSQIPDEIYRTHVLRARSTADHFVFDRKFVKYLKLDQMEALFLQDVINLASLNNTIKTEDDFFLCTEEYLKSSLNWSHKTQQSMLSSLEEKKLLIREKRGIPASRWLWIDIVAIENGIDAGIKQASNASGTTSKIQTDQPVMPFGSTKNGISKKVRESKDSLTVGRAASAASRSELKPESPARRIARKLHDLLLKHNKLMRKVNLSSWEAEIRQLANKRSIANIEMVLDWYVTNINKPFVADIRSARSFMDKFPQLEAAIDKANKVDKDDKINKASNSHGKTSPLFENVRESLNDLTWPNKESYHAMLNRNLLAASEFFDLFSLLEDCAKNEPKKIKSVYSEEGFQNCLLGVRVALDYSVADFIERWFRKLHAALDKWDDWDGRIPAKYLVSIDSPIFQKFITKNAGEVFWEGNDAWWAELKSNLERMV